MEWERRDFCFLGSRGGSTNGGRSFTVENKTGYHNVLLGAVYNKGDQLYFAYSQGDGTEQIA